MDNNQYQLTIECGGQEAQKSHGLCLGKAPDIANLPAGEVYFVPTGASGQFPMKFDDGTIAIMDVGSVRFRGSSDRGNTEGLDMTALG